ncbi:pyocin knob domain-containing protein [Aggregatibacter sp.]
MANLKEQEKWEEGVYQIEENDPVLGGENGITNKPIKQLANRTLWLKKALELFGKKSVPKDLTAESTSTADESGHTHKLPLASVTAKGVVKLNSQTASDSEQDAATPKAVKMAYDKAVEAQKAADNAQSTADSKQSPATTLAGYGINNFKVENGSGNMNDYRTDGIYCFGTLYGVSNSPRDTNSDIGSGNLQVITGGIGNERWCRQIFHVHSSKDTYIRWQVSVTNDDWSAWEKLNDIEPVIRALGTKANISHTHTANQITDFNTAVRNSFSGVSSENGWCKLPNGLILQWGKITLPNLTNEKTGVCTLPVTFPHAVFSIIIGGVSGSISQDGNSQEGFSITQQTTSNFTWVSSWEYRNKDAFNNAPAQWIAIGY